MSDFIVNRMFEKKYTPMFHNRLMRHLLQYDVLDDLKKATDCTVMNLGGNKFAVRGRRYKFYQDNLYGCRDQFTIRYKLTSGHPTEYEKIMQGHADLLFYGFINEDETDFVQYFIGNLDEFRRIMPKPKTTIKNKDNSSTFAVFDIDYFHPGRFIVAYDNLTHWMTNFVRWHTDEEYCKELTKEV